MYSQHIAISIERTLHNKSLLVKESHKCILNSCITIVAYFGRQLNFLP